MCIRGNQTDDDGLLMECMISELQQLRMENIALKQNDSSISQLTLNDLEGNILLLIFWTVHDISRTFDFLTP